MTNLKRTYLTALGLAVLAGVFYVVYYIPRGIVIFKSLFDYWWPEIAFVMGLTFSLSFCVFAVIYYILFDDGTPNPVLHKWSDNKADNKKTTGPRTHPSGRKDVPTKV